MRQIDRDDRREDRQIDRDLRKDDRQIDRDQFNTAASFNTIVDSSAISTDYPGDSAYVYNQVIDSQLNSGSGDPALMIDPTLAMDVVGIDAGIQDQMIMDQVDRDVIATDMIGMDTGIVGGFEERRLNREIRRDDRR